MNLRCFYCQTPFTLGRAEILAGLQRMDTENMNHYDAHCPRCRRANSISRQRMEMFYPNWREAADEQAAMPPVEEQPTRMPAEEGTAAAPVSIMPPVQAMPVEAAQKNAKPTRKRAGAAKKTTAKTATKPAAKEKKPAATKAKPAAKPKSKPAAASSSKGKPASKSKPVVKKKKK